MSALLAAAVVLGPTPATFGATTSGSIAAGADAAIDVEETLLCTFDTAELDEVSGMTMSLQHEGIVWMTNDSGGGPYLYAVDTSDCSIQATLRLLDTPARDHEALAAGRDDQGRYVIWVGDIGDNLNSWPYARVHKVIEPKALKDADVPVTTYRYTYPDGAQDAEALIAAPDRERLWVVTKGDGGGAMFALPSPMDDATTPMEAEELGAARSLVTDAAMAPDGERYVVRDYLSAEVFTGEPIGEPQARFRMPIQQQGEAITWTADSRGLLVASEGSGDLIEVRVPDTALGTDAGIASVLPRVAGFDIYPYVRIVVVVLAGLVGLVLLTRLGRRRRSR